MDWSKTKSIFIVTFLILNIFLSYQFIQKRDGSQLDTITELSIEEQFATEDITFDPLPKEPKEGTYMSGKIKLFTVEDVKKLKDQEVSIENPAVISGVFKEPMKLSGKDKVKIKDFVKQNMISGDSYSVWEVDEEANRIILFQQYQNKVIFNQYTSVNGMLMLNSNISGVVILELNDDDEVTSYQQTLITDFEEYEKEELLTPLETLEILFKNDYLKSGSKVEKVEIGYYPLIPLSESQLFTPTWHIVIDDGTELYVNAIEGQIIQ